MANCLVTKLKGTVDNNDLPILNSIRLKVEITDSSILSADARKIRIAGDVGKAFHVIAGGDVVMGSTYEGTDLGTEFTTSGPSSHDVTFYVSNNEGYIDIIYKFDIIWLRTYGWSGISFDTKDIKYITNLEQIGGGNQCAAAGQISDLVNLSNLKILNVGYSTITGNIKDIPLYCPSIANISFAGNSFIEGKIEEFVQNLPVRETDSVVEIGCANTKVTLNGTPVTTNYKLKFTATGVDVMNVYLDVTYATYTRGSGTWEYFDV